MALAEAYPRPGRPLTGLGQPRRAAGPAAPDGLAWSTRSTTWRTSGTSPRPTGPVRRARSCRLLDHPEPLVRAAAAACLGRLGEPRLGRRRWSAGSATRPRSSGGRRPGRCGGWATGGSGIEAIVAALDSPDPATRRGAARIFAYQFSRDGRRGSTWPTVLRADPRPRPLDPAPGAPDAPPVVLPDGRRRASPAGSSTPTSPGWPSPIVPVVRKALSEGLYIMLDENLGGGVSLQKNIAELPERMRARHPRGARGVRARRPPEPVLAALETGNALQREACSRRSTARSSRAGPTPASRRDDRRRQRPRVRLPLQAGSNELEAAFLPLLRPICRPSRGARPSSSPLLPLAGRDRMTRRSARL